MVETGRWSHAWRALRHPNFRLFFFGQSVSVIGTWLTQVARMWLVYRLTHSALLLGVVSFAGQFVSFVVGPFAGVWVERLDRRKLLLCVQALGAAQSLFLAVVTLAHVITLWEIIALTIFGGFVQALGAPARMSFVAQMVEDRKDVDNGVALVSSMANAARLIGPAIAGLVIAAFGEGWCFLIDTISFVPVLVSLALMRMKPQETRRGSHGMLEEMRQGWSFVGTSVPIRTLLLFFAVIGLMGYSYSVLLPVFASEVLRTGPWGLGLLRASPAIGAGSMALLLAHRPFRSRAGVTMLWCVAGFGVFTVLFGISRSLVLSMAALVLVGSMDMVSVVVRSTLVQLATPDEMRGRVSAVEMIFIGASNEIGQFESGLTAQWLGAVPAVILGGIGTLIVTGLWAWNFPELRRVEKMSSMEN